MSLPEASQSRPYGNCSTANCWPRLRSPPSPPNEGSGPASDLSHSTVDEQLDPINESAFLRCEEDDGSCNLIHCADATHRDRVLLNIDEPFDLFSRQAEQLVTRSRHDTRADGVDANVAALEIEYPIPREASDCSLG